MENINSGSIYKLASIKWLLVTLLIGFSCGVFAEQKQFSFKKQEDSFVVFEANGKWESSAGSTYLEKGNPKFKFKVLKRGSVDIKLLEPDKENGCRSSHIDTYLYLLKDGVPIARNDDYNAWTYGTFHHEFVSMTEAIHKREDFCSLNSGIPKKLLDPGAYEVVAGTFYKGEMGNFRISVGAKDGIIENKKIIRKDFKQNGKWTSSGGQNKSSPGNKHYEFTLTKKSQVTINLTSTYVDTYLFLLAQNGKTILTNDDGGDGLNSKMEGELSAGTYRLVAATFNTGNFGDFVLKLNAYQDYLKDFKEFQKENNQKLKSPTVLIENAEESYGLYKWKFGSDKEYIKVKIKNNNSVTGTNIAEEVDAGLANIKKISNEEFKIYPKKSGYVRYKFYTQAAPDYDDSDPINIMIWIGKGDQGDIFKKDRKEVTLGESDFGLEVNSKGEYKGEIKTYSVDSYDTDIVEVNKKGVVKIKKAGSAFINATRFETERYYESSDYMMIVVKRMKQEVKFDQDIREVKWDQQYNVEDFLDKKGKTTRTYSINNNNAKLNKQGKLAILKHEGTFDITVTAGASDRYDYAYDTITLTIQKGTRTLSVADINRDYFLEGSIQPAPKLNNSSVDGVSYRVIEGNKVVGLDTNGQLMILGAGTAKVQATLPGNQYYNKADANFIITIRKATQSQFEINDVEEEYSANKLITPILGNNETNDDLSYTVIEGNETVSVNNGQLKILGVGTAKVKATRIRKHYEDKTTVFDVNVTKGTRTLSVADINSVYLPNGSIQPAPKLNNSSVDGVSYSVTQGNEFVGLDTNGQLKILGAGTAIVKATHPGDEYYNKADANFEITIREAEQSPFEINNLEEEYSANKLITPTLDNGVTYDGLSYKVISGEEFVSVNNNGQLTILGVGTAQVKATRNRKHYEDKTTEFDVNVTKGNRTLSVADINSVYSPNGSIQSAPKFNNGSADVDADGVTYRVTEGNEFVGLDTNVQLKILGAGTAIVEATLPGNEFYKNANFTFEVTIAKADQAPIQVDDIELYRYFRPADVTINYPIVTGGSVDGPVKFESNAPILLSTEGGLRLHSLYYPNADGVWDNHYGTGTVTAIKEGNSNYKDVFTTFTVTILKPDHKKTFMVNNFDGSKVEALNNKICGDEFTLNVKRVGQTVPDYYDPSSTKVSYSSSDESVVKVDENSGKVSIVSIGTAEIIATLAETRWNAESEIASYTINVTERGNQAIQFKGEKTVYIYGDDEPPVKEISQGWGSENIVYEISDSQSGFTVDAITGLVNFDSDTYSDVIEVDIVASKGGDNCYQEAEDSYSIIWQKNAIHSPSETEKADQEYKIEWSMPDFAEDAEIKFYYTNFPNMIDEAEDTANNANEVTKTGQVGAHVIWHRSKLHESLDKGGKYQHIKTVPVSDGRLIWDTSKLPEGDYYLSAFIDAAKYIDPVYEDGEASEDFDDETGVSEDLSESYVFFDAQRPLIIDHDHGIYDCSQFYNQSEVTGSKPAPSSKCSSSAMALIRPDGSILSWGDNRYDGVNGPVDAPVDAPDGDGFTQIISHAGTFTALKDDGTAVSWGGAYKDRKFVVNNNAKFKSIYASIFCSAAISEDGGVTVWGLPYDSGSSHYEKYFRFHTPTTPLVNGTITFPKSEYKYTKVVHTGGTYDRSCNVAALREDGVITYLRHGEELFNTPPPNMEKSPFYREFYEEGMSRREIHDAYRKWRFDFENNGSFFFVPITFTDSETSGYIDIIAGEFGIVALHEDGSLGGSGSTFSLAGNGDHIGIFRSLKDEFSTLKADGSVGHYANYSYSWGWRGFSAHMSIQLMRYINKLYYYKSSGTLTDWGVDDFTKGLKSVFPEGAARFQIYEMDEYFQIDQEILGPLKHIPVNDRIFGTPLVTIPFNCYNKTGTISKNRTSINGEVEPICDLRDVPVKAAETGKLKSGKTYMGLTFVEDSAINDDAREGDSWMYTFLWYSNFFITYDDVNGLTPPDFERLGSIPDDFDFKNAEINTGGTGFTTINDMGDMASWGARVWANTQKEYYEEAAGVLFDKIIVASEDFSFYSKLEGKIYYKDQTASCQNNPCFWNLGPHDDGYIKVFSNVSAFAALRADGSIVTWGKKSRDKNCGAKGAPTDKGYISIYSSMCSFTAIKADGTIATWGTLGDFEGPWPTHIDDPL